MQHLHRTRIAGFSLIEVLIALVILSIGLLGIAAMVSESLKSKDSSYYRTQALDLASAIVDRMRANRTTATSNGYDATTYGSIPGTAPSDYCKTSACSTAQLASADVAEWQHEIGVLLPAFPSGTPAQGEIITSSVGQMTQVNVSIEWYDRRANQAVNNATSTAAPIAATGVVYITSGL
ncbi:MAG TPA: type IV pilus modification protein PilV [Gammaproteobacteria bacterium]